MLNISVKPADTVLLYNSEGGGLLGSITFRNVNNQPAPAEGGPSTRVDLEFRMPPSVVIVREKLVKSLTADISVCPPELLKKFSPASAAVA